ncbi:3-oxoacyl-[acyl-carrier protein] reductase [Nocardioides exalbidus]|uniref:3-oxoacyl-[acyl-carrier protein] reductase n=1 Tax=Nocardioides exalbidus TaxID=402596 RepID=A0A1H4YWB1_9ACTN|nr:SDR family oxidoreductase [Nocardioides exalbidus]SED21967.1 3-oxoacyl-[acyl-carrier protein] reductase [Nocardioides exalbidus]
MDLQLADRVFIVTGGARGLGRASADALVAEGARVVLSGRSQESLDAAVATLNDAAGREAAVGVAVDNSERGAPARLLAAADSAWGRIDGALISVGGPPKGPVTTITDEQWTAAFESVFLGAVRLAREVGTSLPAGGALGLVLSSSVRSPLPEMAISNGLRPGLAMVAKTLADELGPRGVRVNGLLPGRIATERVAELDASTGDPEAARHRAEATIPLGRYGEPEEFGAVAAFVMSPAASFLTGVMLPVDGGLLRAL